VWLLPLFEVKIENIFSAMSWQEGNHVLRNDDVHLHGRPRFGQRPRGTKHRRRTAHVQLGSPTRSVRKPASTSGRD